MGCLGIEVVDPEVEKILASLDSKMEEYKDTFVKDFNKVKKKLEDLKDNRKKELSKLKEEKKEITEQVLKDLNKKELKVEQDFLKNAVDKMHYIFSVGLELVEPLRKVTLDGLLEKAKSAPAITLNQINKQIEEVKKISPIEFLNATYGKVLKDALEKKGMSVAFMNGTRKRIFKERQERRKLEREEFGIKVNEFEDETIDNIKLDLGDIMYGEKGEEFTKELNKNFKDFIRDKQVENKH